MGVITSKDLNAIQEFSKIGEVVPDPIIITDENERIVYYNQLANHLFEYTTEELMGQPLSSIVDYELNSQSEGVRSAERCRAEKKNGDTLEVEVSSRNIFTNYKNFACLTIRKHSMHLPQRRIAIPELHVTSNGEDQVESDRIQNIISELESRLNELESFSYAVSHDLRAPLRGINGFTALFIKKYSDKVDGEGRRLLQRVTQNVDKMELLIDDLVNLFRIGLTEINHQEIDVDKVVKSVLKNLKIDTSKYNITIGKLGKLRGDPTMILQVYKQLISNAIKFSKDVSHPEIEIGSYIKADETTFYVKDNGVGFDPEYAGKLFGIFQRLHAPIELSGTGIGLAIVKKIVTRHGGRVWAEGEENGGATFYFSLIK